MKYRIIGTLGSGTADIVIEWAEMERYQFADPNINFQVVLHESDNSIDFNYGKMQLYNGSSQNTLYGYYSYSIGLNGANPAAADFSNRTILQNANSANFGTASQNELKASPACNSQLRFVPAAVYSGGSAPSAVVVNDNPAGALTLPVNVSACTDLCGNVYSSSNATATASITACSATTAGTPDDDVFFSFTTTLATAYRFEAIASTNYDVVIQVLDAALVPVACSNSVGLGLSEVIASLSLVPSTQYYLRVYDASTGAASGTLGNGEFALCISEVVPPPAYDEPAGALSLTVGTTCTPTSSVPAGVLAATGTTGVQTCTGTPDDDVWYKFTTSAAANGVAHTINVQGVSTFNPVLQIFTGVPGASNSLTCLNATANGGLETYTSSSLLANTDYYIRVYHAGAGAANGNFTVCVSAAIPSCVSSGIAPANGSTVCSSPNETTLTWDGVANATGYDVYFDNTSGATLVSANQPGTSYTTPAPLANGTYTWRIIPKNGYGSATGCSSYTFTVNSITTYYADADGDGYGNAASTTFSCDTLPPAGYSANSTDCNDMIAAINPGATEIYYDGVDNNCNNQLDEGNQLKTKLLAESCGATLAAINSLIGITTVNSTITGYRIRVTNGSQVQIIERTVPHFTLTHLPVYNYETTYTVEIELQKSGIWLGYYGDPCLVSSPAILTSGGAAQISPSQCGITLARMNTLIATTSLTGATGYRFRVTNITEGASGPNVVQTIDRNLHWFSLVMLTQYNYQSTYRVEVAVKTNGAYSGFGTPCEVNSPAAPTLINCNAVIATSGSNVAATSLTGVTQYRFQVTRMSDGSTTTIDRPNNYFRFAMIPSSAFTPAAQYAVRVAVMTVGTWSPFGDACEVTSPGAAARFATETAPEATASAFKAVAYPNPFASSFGVNVTTSAAEKVQLKVYDMAGRLLESRESNVSEVNTLTVGDRYPSGVYNVIVTQGANVETLRVIKR